MVRCGLVRVSGLSLAVSTCDGADGVLSSREEKKTSFLIPVRAAALPFPTHTWYFWYLGLPPSSGLQR